MSFKVGDLVRIREYDDLLEEYGYEDGEIATRYGFIEEMKYMCGKEFVIEYIEEDGEVKGHNDTWTITTEVIEKVDNNKKLTHLKSKEIDIQNSILKNLEDAKTACERILEDVKAEIENTKLYIETLRRDINKKDN